MNARSLPASVLPARFAVTITFEDGEYKNDARAYSEAQAINLATIDARMASPNGTFAGKVLAAVAEPYPR